MVDWYRPGDPLGVVVYPEQFFGAGGAWGRSRQPLKPANENLLGTMLRGRFESTYNSQLRDRRIRQRLREIIKEPISLDARMASMLRKLTNRGISLTPTGQKDKMRITNARMGKIGEVVVKSDGQIAVTIKDFLGRGHHWANFTNDHDAVRFILHSTQDY